MSDTLAVMPPVLSCQSAVQHRGGQVATVALNLAEEVPTALVYNGISHAVLMTTPQHWRELAYGFSLTEGIVGQAHDIYAVELDPQPQGMLGADDELVISRIGLEDGPFPVHRELIVLGLAWHRRRRAEIAAIDPALDREQCPPA